jgi:hypothetical protein
VRHGTCGYIHTYINAVANCVTYDIIFITRETEEKLDGRNKEGHEQEELA